MPFRDHKCQEDTDRYRVDECYSRENTPRSVNTPPNCRDNDWWNSEQDDNDVVVANIHFRVWEEHGSERMRETVPVEEPERTECHDKSDSTPNKRC